MRLQSQLEERLNTYSHALGGILGVIGLVLLILKVDDTQPWYLFSVIIYGISIITLFMASTFYHASTGEKRKHYFRIVDHISIYLLIAGTYTPVLLITLKESLGWPLFYTVWGIAGFGLILKIFYTGRFEIFSTLLYLVMGWLIVSDFSTLKSLLPAEGIYCLFAGGAFYTLGILFYLFERIPYNHVIWHFFVLGGAISHFLMIYLFVV